MKKINDKITGFLGHKSVSGDTTTVTFRLVEMVDLDPVEIKNIIDRELVEYENLVVTCMKTDSINDWFGFSVRYKLDCLSVGILQITKMKTLLTKIERQLKTDSEKFGRAKDFGSYVMRVAAVIGVEHIAFSEDETIESIRYKDFSYTAIDATNIDACKDAINYYIG